MHQKPWFKLCIKSLAYKCILLSNEKNKKEIKAYTSNQSPMHHSLVFRAYVRLPKSGTNFYSEMICCKMQRNEKKTTSCALV